jgi:hypothetical protein
MAPDESSAIVIANEIERDPHLLARKRAWERSRRYWFQSRAGSEHILAKSEKSVDLFRTHMINLIGFGAEREGLNYSLEHGLHSYQQGDYTGCANAAHSASQCSPKDRMITP